MSRKARLTIRGLALVAALLTAVIFSPGEARASLGPAYNAQWQHADCYGSQIQIDDPYSVADLAANHRIAWTTVLWRSTANTGWTLAVEGRDYTKNVARSVYHYGWAYRQGFSPDTLGVFVPDYQGVDRYTITNPGRYAVQGAVYYYAARDWRVQDLRLNYNNQWYSAWCQFG
jgi:hypothetical protein